MIELRDSVDAAGLTATGPLGGVFDDSLFTDEHGHALLYLPVPDPGRGRSGAGLYRAGGRTRPGRPVRIAYNADRIYAALGVHVAATKPGAAGPVREHYLIGPLDTDDVTRWVTEIAWPR